MYRYLFLLLTLLSLPTHSQTIAFNEWMKSIADATPLCHISIPGTHDSGALEGGEAFQTQELTLEEQLEAGVRCFDIRLKACDNNLLGVYHSIVFQDAYWETDVLPTFLTFLKEHPTELLIVMLKKEGGNDKDFSTLLTKSLQDTLHSKTFVQDVPKDLTLGACRGKILFIHRDHLLTEFPGAQCHEWQNNATCRVTLKDAQGNDTPLSVEDEYQFASAESAPYKVETTWKHMTSASLHPSSVCVWSISFASATALPEEGPQAFANHVNSALAQRTATLTHPCGIILIDFAGTKDGKTLLYNIIRSNKISN